MEEFVAIAKTFGVLAVLVWYIVYSETRIRPRVDSEHAKEREIWRAAMTLEAQASRETLQRMTVVLDDLASLMRDVRDRMASHEARHRPAPTSHPPDQSHHSEQ